MEKEMCLITYKICTKCNQSKSLDEFVKNKRCKNGVFSYCKICHNNANKGKYSVKARRKFIIVAHYSMGEMCCRQCRYNNIKGLCVDHINGNGTEHRKSIKSYDLYRWLIKNDFPDGFQILCFNCNSIKRIDNKEFGGKKCSSIYRKSIKERTIQDEANGR